MYLDKILSLTAAIEFITFLVIHVVVFRRLKQEQVLKGIISIYLSISGILLIIESILFYWYTTNFLLVIFMVGVIWILYSLLVFLYLIGIFGIIESSLRIRLLQLVTQRGNQGISYKLLLKKYNKQMIIEKRLLRLINSGELIYKNGQYQINKNFSLFYIPAYMALIMKKLYDLN